MDMNDRSNNHAYKYMKVNKNKITYSPKGGYKVYHRGPNGWSYEIENKKKFFSKMINQRLYSNKLKEFKQMQFKR
jgi:hypothetical protein